MLSPRITRVGTYRGAGEICGVDPKTVKRKVLAHEAGSLDGGPGGAGAGGEEHGPGARCRATQVARSKGRRTAKRLLPIGPRRGLCGVGSELPSARRGGEAPGARRVRSSSATAGGVGAGRHVGDRLGHLPGGGLKVFCAVLAWSRVRFVRVARDETAATTFALLAECFEVLGGVPAKVLADRMGCLKAGVVANVVIPTADYVRFATHYRFTPDFCHAADPESKGIVEHLVGYAKRDLVLPDDDDLAVLNAPRRHGGEVNAREHSETCAVPTVRLDTERSLLRPLPMLRPRIGRSEIRKVDKLSTSGSRRRATRSRTPRRRAGRVRHLRRATCGSTPSTATSSPPRPARPGEAVGVR